MHSFLIHPAHAFTQAAFIQCTDLFKQYNEQNAEESNASGDVVISQSADGFKLFVYYFDHYAQTIGGYSVNCIKM